MFLADSNGMHWLDIVFLVVAVILIILSLLQGGKSDGASGAITGGGLNIFAKQKENAWNPKRSKYYGSEIRT